MRRRSPVFRRNLIGLLFGLTVAMLLSAGAVMAQNKPEKSFSAVMTDSHGIDTEVKNLLFYWEERISETAFVPHELKQIPVKRGNATVNVRFDTIKQVDVTASADKGLPLIGITLTNGKTGEFVLAIRGSFKGESDFGEVELPANDLKKVVFK